MGRRLGFELAECFVWVEKVFEVIELLNQRGIDFLPGSRLEDLDFSWVSILRCNRGSRGALDIFLTRIRGENRNVNLFSERGELFDRGRSLQIQGNQCGHATLFL